MSQAARITLGVAMLLLAACFIALAPFMKDVSPQAGRVRPVNRIFKAA
jgi:hypothetical protein